MEYVDLSTSLASALKSLPEVHRRYPNLGFLAMHDDRDLKSNGSSGVGYIPLLYEIVVACLIALRGRRLKSRAQR